MPRNREALLDIADAIAVIGQYLEGMTREAFWKDLRTQDAVIRRFSVIGEATRKIDEATRQRFNQIPWAKMAGLRNRVIHDYTAVNLDVLWETAHENLPQLAQQIQELLKCDDF